MKTRASGDFRRSGFTLIEVLVAMAITVALGGLAVSIAVNSLGIWHRVEGDFLRGIQARRIFDFIGSDLHAAIHDRRLGPWLAVELQNSPTILHESHGWLIDSPIKGRIKPDGAASLNAVPTPDGSNRTRGIGGARFGQGGVWLRLFALDGTGRPVAVSYQLARSPAQDSASANRGEPHYLLVRGLATDTLQRGWDITGGYDDVLAAPGASAALADGVVDFGVWLYAHDASAADGLRRIFPIDAGDLSRFAPHGGEGGANSDYPVAVDVMVRILSAEGAAELANLENGRGRGGVATDAEWWSLVESQSSVFVHRIELKGSGL